MDWSILHWAARLFSVLSYTFSETIIEYNGYDEEPSMKDLMEWIGDEVCLRPKIFISK